MMKKCKYCGKYNDSIHCECIGELKEKEIVNQIKIKAKEINELKKELYSHIKYNTYKPISDVYCKMETEEIVKYCCKGC